MNNQLFFLFLCFLVIFDRVFCQNTIPSNQDILIKQLKHNWAATRDGKSAFQLSEYYKDISNESLEILWLTRSSDVGYGQAQYSLAALLIAKQDVVSLRKAKLLIDKLTVEMGEAPDPNLEKQVQILRKNLMIEVRAYPPINTEATVYLTSDEIKEYSSKWSRDKDVFSARRLAHHYFVKGDEEAGYLWLGKAASNGDVESKNEMTSILIESNSEKSQKE